MFVKDNSRKRSQIYRNKYLAGEKNKTKRLFSVSQYTGEANLVS